MPRGDGTGPQGLGPRTGRGAWLCTDPEQGTTDQGFGVGAGRGLGRGRGICRRMTPGAGRVLLDRSTAASVETEALRNRIRHLEQELAAVTKRLEEIGNN